MRQYLRTLVARVAGYAFDAGLRHRGLHLSDLTGPDKGAQLLLLLRYRELATAGGPLPDLLDVGFHTFAQADEDGILLYLFGLLGMGSRRGVEIGASDGVNSNLANLVVHHRWSALMLEGDPAAVARGQQFYSRRGDACMAPPRLVSAWVEPGNVNRLLSEHGFDREIDLLSLDVDGLDYWIWDALEFVPRVIVVEYNNMWPAAAAVTLPNRPEFRYSAERPDYYGASLAAFVKLGRRKGYRFVGCNGHGFNAFFVREAEAGSLLPEASVEACLNRPWALHRRATILPRAREWEWVEV